MVILTRNHAAMLVSLIDAVVARDNELAKEGEPLQDVAVLDELEQFAKKLRAQAAKPVPRKDDFQQVWIVSDEAGEHVMMCPAEPTPEALADTESKIDQKCTVDEFLILPATFAVPASPAVAAVADQGPAQSLEDPAPTAWACHDLLGASSKPMVIFNKERAAQYAQCVDSQTGRPTWRVDPLHSAPLFVQQEPTVWACHDLILTDTGPTVVFAKERAARLQNDLDSSTGKPTWRVEALYSHA